MKIKVLIILIAVVCAFHSGAQTLTATYIELADSADRYIRTERWADAERVIIEALRHEPANKSNYLLWSNLGNVRTRTGNYTGALEAFNIGLASAPKSTTLLTNRSRTYLALGHLDEAVKDMSDALEVDSTLQWPLKMRGLTLASTGHTDKALEDFDTYEKKYGTDASIEEARGDIDVNSGKLDEALSHYKKAYELEPEERLLTKTLTAAYLFGKLEDMENELSEGLRKYPRNGTLYALRAAINRSKFQTDAMESDLQTAREYGADPKLIETIGQTGKGKSK